MVPHKKQGVGEIMVRKTQNVPTDEEAKSHYWPRSTIYNDKPLPPMRVNRHSGAISLPQLWRTAVAAGLVAALAAAGLNNVPPQKTGVAQAEKQPYKPLRLIP